ncbi:MAG: hypothetical protein KY447_09050 [Actinobacteria bacterium]|nr:hypothetical protein [Actinomycetota bacterium]MBW3643045.1 hypothetical protein [Actinomycetota bacterium]
MIDELVGVLVFLGYGLAVGVALVLVVLLARRPPSDTSRRRRRRPRVRS